MKILQIENIIKEVFDEEKGVVKSVDTVYEKIDDNSLKLVISIHNLSVEDTIIIHTKFIFKVNKEKTEIIDNSFIYLYDINCIYHSVNFVNQSDLKLKLKRIIESNKFGRNIQLLSEFIETPATKINLYFKDADNKYSVTNVIYNPKFKTAPCEETTFDFDINVNNSYDLCMTIYKKEDDFIIRVKFLNNEEVYKVDSLLNINLTVGAKIEETLDKILK